MRVVSALANEASYKKLTRLGGAVVVPSGTLGHFSTTSEFACFVLGFFDKRQCFGCKQ